MTLAMTSAEAGLPQTPEYRRPPSGDRNVVMYGGSLASSRGFWARASSSSVAPGRAGPRRRAVFGPEGGIALAGRAVAGGYVAGDVDGDELLHPVLCVLLADLVGRVPDASRQFRPSRVQTAATRVMGPSA